MLGEIDGLVRENSPQSFCLAAAGEHVFQQTQVMLLIPDNAVFIFVNGTVAIYHKSPEYGCPGLDEWQLLLADLVTGVDDFQLTELGVYDHTVEEMQLILPFRKGEVPLPYSLYGAPDQDNAVTPVIFYALLILPDILRAVVLEKDGGEDRPVCQQERLVILPGLLCGSIDLSECNKIPLYRRLIRAFFKLFAPFM